MKKRNQFLTFYMPLIIVLGTAAIVFSAFNLPVAALDGRFLIIAAVALICSGTTIQFPRVQSAFDFSDPFIFLTLLFFGAEAAVLLATLAGLVTSLRICKKKISIFFNVAMMGLSTFLTAAILQFCFGSIRDLWRGGFSARFIVALCVMGLAQYFINTGLSAIYGASKKNENFFVTWKNSYLWNSISYFSGATAAGIIARLSDTVGFYALVVVSPIVVILYLTHRMYLKNIEISIAQAEQSQTHAAALQESEERFRSAFDYASSGMALVSPGGDWLQVNQAFCEIAGYGEREMLKTAYRRIVHPDDYPETLRKFNDLLAGATPACQMEKRYVHRSGETIWVQWSASTVLDARGKLLCLIFQVQNINARKRAEEQLQHEASHDALTGLPNRVFFADRLHRAFERARLEPDYQFAVVFLDLDRFKIINDSLGHAVGDQLLVNVARRLENCVREGDVVSRFGGDEFTVLLSPLKSGDEALEIAERISQSIARPFELSGHEIFTSASIGIASSRTDCERAEDLLRDADAAMYLAKSRGKARFEIFNQDLRARADSILQMETDLHRAVERGEFLLHYQPIVSLDDGKIVGFESLLRWHHPQHGFVLPNEFVPLAEDLGLINSIGLWTLREACRQMSQWQNEFPRHPPLVINVNLSGKQLAQSDLAEQVRRVLIETELDPRSLNLEITESILMNNEGEAIENLRKLRELGVKISLDDFGTGYSSLSYLHRFPIDALKIDRSFINKLHQDAKNEAIVRTILLLGQNLNIETIAEGIETEHQLENLRLFGCRRGQGYLFSKPTNADSAAEFLRDGLPNEFSPTLFSFGNADERQLLELDKIQ